MPGPNTISFGNTKNSWILGVTLSPVSVAPNTSAEQTFSVTGLLTTDDVTISKPAWQAGLAICNARVSAANTLAVAFGNFTSATITPTAAESYTVEVNRPDTAETMAQVI